MVFLLGHESRIDILEQVHEEIIHVRVLVGMLVQSEQRARKDLDLLGLAGLELFRELFDGQSLFGRLFFFIFRPVPAPRHTSGC